MTQRCFPTVALTVLLASHAANAAEQMKGESLVLAGEKPGQLLGRKMDPKSVVVRSTYLPGGTVYEPNRDYRFDADTDTIARTPGSRIPDFSTNNLYGQKDFDHSKFPGYGNTKFLVFVDYKYDEPLKLTTSVDATALLPKTIAKLNSKQPLKLIAFGDSITAGGEASSVELQFPSLYAKHLEQTFPGSKVTIENGATGGDNTVMGLARLNDKVLARKPDLVLVAFGMNDHNVGGVAPEAFKANLEKMVDQIREKTGAEVILLSTFPPNPEWHYSARQMWKYAKATREAAQDKNVAYADVYSLWKKVLERKDPPSLLGNNINHPTDFGHALYELALESLKLDK
jgi:lysophospholipase L1-like esterase